MGRDHTQSEVFRGDVHLLHSVVLMGYGHCFLHPLFPRGEDHPYPVVLKPVLNWANVCSPNILRTVRRTMIRFLIELLVRRTWFRQRTVRRTLLRSQLACNEMQASARTCGRRAADSMIENVG